MKKTEVLKTDENSSLVNECIIKADMIEQQKKTIQNLERALKEQLMEHDKDNMETEIIKDKLNFTESSLMVGNQSLIVMNTIVYHNLIMITKLGFFNRPENFFY